MVITAAAAAGELLDGGCAAVVVADVEAGARAVAGAAVEWVPGLLALQPASVTAINTAVVRRIGRLIMGAFRRAGGRCGPGTRVRAIRGGRAHRFHLRPGVRAKNRNSVDGTAGWPRHEQCVNPIARAGTVPVLSGRESDMNKSLLLMAPVAAFGAAALALAPAASAQPAAMYQATLNPLNHASGSGSLMLMLSGSQATVTEHVTGLAATFGGAAYPHVQHIHIGAQGVCPPMSADTNGDGVISTTEGAPFYGGIGTTLSVSGDTSPAAGTDIKIAPSGGSFDYSRTITLDAATLASVTAGKAVIVVHGLDPTTLSKQAQGEKSDLVPSLPLAATSPALCGTLVASQMTAVPGGPPNTGGGSTAGLQDESLLFAGGGLLAAAGLAGAGTLALRRRTARQS